MAGEQNTAAVGYEKIYDMGTGLIIAKVQIDKVREQDINARIMKKEMQDQLTANIKNRGQLESLPLLAEKDGVLEIVSGHHRIKSARAAGMKEIIAIIDVSGLSRSKIASKQLAHNAISGFDDPSVLREICKMLDDVDDMLESFIGEGHYGGAPGAVQQAAVPGGTLRLQEHHVFVPAPSGEGHGCAGEEPGELRSRDYRRSGV